MATIISPQSTVSNNGLELLGFVNPPESPTGRWVIKSQPTNTFPGYSVYTIPLVISKSGGDSWADVSPSNASRSATASINNIAFGQVSGRVSGNGQTNRGLTAENTYVFLPCFYGFDLTAIQSNETSVNATAVLVWLEAE